MRLRIDIAYDGTNYQGWQEQPHTDLTIQTQLQLALKTLFQIKVFGSGRTDAGVHARGQVAHFDLPDGTLSDRLRPRLMRAINSQLPEDIAVQAVYEAPPLFHARHGAASKVYKYQILNSSVPDPLLRLNHTWVRRPLSLERLNQLTSCLVGEHDFKSFQSAGSDVPTSVRTVLEASWLQTGKNTLEFQILGNSSGFGAKRG